MLYKCFVPGPSKTQDVELMLFWCWVSVVDGGPAVHGLTTLNKPKSGQVSTNKGIMTQNIFNVSVLTSVELKTNTNRL